MKQKRNAINDKPKNTLRKNKPKPERSSPKTAQKTIPYKLMYPDGICQVKEGYFSKVVQYQDINYQLAQEEDKRAIFDKYCEFLNYFDSSIHVQLCFYNYSGRIEDYQVAIKIEEQKDAFNDIRQEYSQMLRNQLAKGNNGLIKNKYLVFGIEANDYRTAKTRLERIELDIFSHLRGLGAIAQSLNGAERLHVMHDLLNESQHKFHFDWKRLKESGLATKDFIAPSGFDFTPTGSFGMGRKQAQVSYLQILAPELSDELLKNFLILESDLAVTLHIQSIEQTAAIKMIKRKITDLDKMKIEEQKKAIRSGYDMDILPSDLVTYGAEAKTLLESLQSRNERLFLVTFLLMNIADNKRKLENDYYQTAGRALYYEGRICDSMPFLEKFRRFDNDDQYLCEFNKDYKDLMSNVLDMFPDIRWRLKMNPKTGKIEMGADVQSVFDIAWYTFARMVADVAPPVDEDLDYMYSQGSILTCMACGEYFVRHSSRQRYCNNPKCQAERNNRKSREHYKRKKNTIKE